MGITIKKLREELSDKQFITALHNRLQLYVNDRGRLKNALEYLTGTYSLTFSQMRILENTIKLLDKPMHSIIED